MKILIGGHAMSSAADEKFNLKLSKKRAKAVYDYLISKGIDKKRLQYVGYGSSKPVYEGQKAADNARNRCVDFTILSN
jgi:outer membrane protein OmpA-like peptidoglycan-associated protein